MPARTASSRLRLRCPAGRTCRGAVTLRAVFTRRVHGHPRTIRVVIAHAVFGARRGTFTLSLHLKPIGRALLRRHRQRLDVTVTLALAGSPAHLLARGAAGLNL